MRAFYQAPTDEQFSSRYSGVGAGTTSGGTRRASSSSSSQPQTSRRDTAAPDRTRNTQVEQRRSSMPGTPKNRSFDENRRDIATEFNKSYEEAGIQPTSLEERRTKTSARRRRYESVEQIERSEARQQQRRQQAAATRRPKRKTTKSISRIVKPQAAVRSLKGRAAMYRAMSLAAYVWFFAQLPFALLSAFFLAVSEAIYQLLSGANGILDPQTDGSWIVNLGKKAANTIFDTIASAINYIAENALGFDITVLNPAHLSIIFYLLVVAIGWSTLGVLLFGYKIKGINCLFGGTHAGLKVGTFLLAFIGYCVPVVNLLPLFIFWALAVLRYPK